MENEPRPTKSFPVFTAWADVETGIYNGPLLTPVGIALLAACFVAVGCSIGAFIRRERIRFLSVVPAIPSLLLLVLILVRFLH
jgi:uncharacterized membrane protein YoaK (UPF0700 family)